MKNFRNIMTLLILFTISNMAIAARVSEQTAKNVAFNFMQKVDSRMTSSSLTLDTNVYANIYIFGYSHGFVIVSGNDVAHPILAYSTERPFPKNTDTIVGNNFWGMIKSYEQQITYAVQNNISASIYISNEWKNLNNNHTTRQMNAVVAPLLTTTWDQIYPYNALCPVDASGPGGHVYTGCVSTALGQILKYHNYPAQGLGSYGYQYGSYPQTTANFGATTYNWGNMPNNISTFNTDVATLLYQTAVSCRSMWGSTNTGVFVSQGEDPMTRALINYFKFAFSSIQYIEKVDYTATQWDSILQSELLANRPIYYTGDGVGTHAWVCDGVDASDMYHFNYGWGGIYNGYYALSAITPGSNNFTNDQNAIIGIKPNDGSTLVSNTTWSGTVSKSTHIAVPDAITLTVNPGAVIKFTHDCKLQIFGRIISTGTSTNYVKFTAIDTTTGWLGIKWDNDYMNNEVMADNDTSKMIFTQIEYSKDAGIYCKSYNRVIINHAKINNNHGYSGGGISIWYLSVGISYSEIYNNSASSSGGGILVNDVNSLTSNIFQNDIYNNTAIAGGGVFLSCNTLFEKNNVHDNFAGNGAGVALMFGTPTLTNSTFCNNTTPLTGRGAIYIENCTANIVDNLIANNTASGIFCLSTSSNIVNNTIVNNNGHYGSGMFFNNNSDPYIKNCILYGNVANNPIYGNQITIGDANSRWSYWNWWPWQFYIPFWELY